MHTVVVGGGFGGVKVAREISKRQVGRVTLISDEDYFLHHATLYETATGRSHDESVIPLEDAFSDCGNVKVVKDRIKGLDVERKLVVGKDKSYRYDNLVVAMGVVTTYFGIDGMKEHSYGIKTLKEIKQFNRHLHQDLLDDGRFDKHHIVIGGGPTGVELAGALSEYLDRLAESHQVKRSKPRIMLVEASDRLLPRLSKTASKKTKKRLEQMGVKVLTGKAVEKLDDDSIVIDGKTYSTQTAIWTSGVANHPFFGRHSSVFELSPNGRVVVDRHMMAAPNIYVIGDNAFTPYSGVAMTALSNAKFVADHLARKAAKRPLPAVVHRKPPSSVPIGEDWAYVEWKGVYVAGRTGAWLRRQIELYGLRSLLSWRTALKAWRAHHTFEETCRLCKISNK